MTALNSLHSPEVRAFARTLGTPIEAQREVLMSIVRANEDCVFGRRASFASVKTVDDFRRSTPVAKYDAFAAAIDRIVHGGEQGLLTTEPVRRFFLTSGSSAKSKYVPVTRALLTAKSRAFGIFWASVFEAHPEVTRASVLTNFSDSGRPVETPGGLPCCSESAYWAAVTRATALGRAPLIPEAVGQIGDSEARYYVLARMLLGERFTGIMSLNPSTMLLLFEKVVAHASALADDLERGGLREDIEVSASLRAEITRRYEPDPTRAAALRRMIERDEVLAHRLWPELRLGICWRSPMLTPYIALLDRHLGDCAQRDFITMASEGVVSIPVDPATRGGPLAVGSHFYEFIPHAQADAAEPQTLLAHELQVGQRYVVVLTTQGGLYRYNIGDVVEVTGFTGETPCIEFLHRAGSTCSLTGEKLTEDQVTDAMADATSGLDVSLEAFTMAPAPEGFPRYIALLEFKEAHDPTRALLQGLPHRLDEALEQRNIEYGSKRSSQRLGAPEVWVVRRGSYERFRRQRLASGTSDSQFKPIHLTRDINFCEQFAIQEKLRAR